MTTTEGPRAHTSNHHGTGASALDGPMLWPPSGGGTRLILSPSPTGLPIVTWLGDLGDGHVEAGEPHGLAGGPSEADAGSMPVALLGAPLLTEHARGWFTRPALRGHRLAVDGDDPAAGRDWSTALQARAVTVEPTVVVIEAEDLTAGLELRTTLEQVPGGGLRARHELTNTGDSPFVVDGLEVVYPLQEQMTEILDFTGRHLNERVPQRHDLTDGLWLRESRRGRPGLGSATMLVAGQPGFSTEANCVVAVHVAWSGNTTLGVERDSATTPTIGGGELLLPGEVVLGQGECYTTPWVWAVASNCGLDGVAAAFHDWLRSQPAHPAFQPVTLNVWEAVYFDHSLERLSRLAELAARVGAERFVLDDGWFRHRRDDHAGLGDWWVDEKVWPDGLAPLADLVHGLGMELGLWFEPEMVNPDSDLYRAHPDWVLATGNRLPLLQRNQLVLDLGNRRVWEYLLERIDAVLTQSRIDYVKWDHNRDLLEAGSGTREGAPAVHAQTAAYYALLDELRGRHPGVAWESCASGGGRIDLGVLSRVQRVWTSDMTDALARQRIQRWTTQLVPPEYLGAHVSAAVSHQTGRTFSLDFRAATAFWGAFGIEWDLTTASEADLDRLACWTALYKRFRPLLHTGRVVRPLSPDPTVQINGVVAADRSEALLAVAQLDVPSHTRGVTVHVPRLDDGAIYAVQEVHPPEEGRREPPARIAEASGLLLRTVGIRLPGARRPGTAVLLHVSAADRHDRGGAASSIS